MTQSRAACLPATAPAGELYVADHGNGRIFRIVDSSQLPPKRRSIRH
jgi:hypothetical protein